MITVEKDVQVEKKYNIVTKGLSNLCHRCEICAYADRKPSSSFGKVMRWHRTWCPAWAAHTMVYGEKSLLK